MLKLIAKTVLTAVVAGGLCVGGVARADEMSSIDPIYKKQPPTQMPTQQTSGVVVQDRSVPNVPAQSAGDRVPTGGGRSNGGGPGALDTGSRMRSNCMSG